MSDELTSNESLKTFDKTVRFDMGRYDFPSEGSRSGFFSNGAMYAALNCVENTPDDSDLLNSSVMNGANTSALSLRRCVGSRSVAHCLAGSLRMASMTSSTLIFSIYFQILRP